MQRIKTMLIAMIAVFAIGSVGASAASAADGNGVASIPGAGSCEVSFQTDGWDPGDVGPPSSWLTNVSDMLTTPGGDCDVDNVEGDGQLEKWSDGYAEFGTDGITFEVDGGIFGTVSCTYAGTLTGIWYWTADGTAVDPAPAMNGSPPVGSPGDDKYFQLSGTANLQPGSHFFCPSTSPVDLRARTHEH